MPRGPEGSSRIPGAPGGEGADTCRPLAFGGGGVAIRASSALAALDGLSARQRTDCDGLPEADRCQSCRTQRSCSLEVGDVDLTGGEAAKKIDKNPRPLVR